jgi:hypothetical protein
MRRLAILAIVLGCAAPSTLLASAAGAATPGTKTPSPSDLNRAAFLPGAGPTADPIGNLLDRNGLAGWTASETPLFTSGGAYDSLRIREGVAIAGPGELPLSQRSAIDPKAYELSVIRNWPGALSFGAGRLSVDVSPHAGVGVIGGDRARGSSAEAGAEVSLSKSELAGERLKAMGVKDGAQFGQAGRWYLFAAASGRAVGMNMLHGDSGWSRAGWSTDATSKLVGDAQLGVGYRKGPVQTSLGYVHRKVKGEHLMYGIDPHDDDMVAFSLSIRPRK